MTILKITELKPYKKVICKCDCGNIKEFYLSNIIPKPKARYTVSCGCKKSDIVSYKNTKHGMYNDKFYKKWRSMFDRTLPSYICYNSYVGVTVCNRWSNFLNFKSDMYESYLKHLDNYGYRNTTLDRINPFGNYEPSNCRWATIEEQAHNKKKNY